MAMPLSTSIHRTRRPNDGFTLVEMVVSVLLVSMMAAAVGSAIFHSRQKAARAKDDFQSRYSQNHLLKGLARELRWATSIDPCSTSENFRFIIPDPEGTAEETITIRYSLDTDNNRLMRTEDNGDQRLAGESIYDATIQVEAFQAPDAMRVSQIKLKLQLGPEETDAVEMVVPLLNTPTFDSIQVE